ncbi:MAG: hypothetical protein JWM72_4760 [Actinomycetia bacterium]|jgi:hypothetical protein|nr:hypothetical protein [Actinomycetes bacterium]MDQ1462361.1 hypothetical protein [Actinomycetota bacterium]
MRTVNLERLETAAAPMLEPAARAYIEHGAHRHHRFARPCT